MRIRFEKLNPAPPDKEADRIAGALVDLAYKQQENPKIAVEVLVGHRVCHVIAKHLHLAVEDVSISSPHCGSVVVDYVEVPKDVILQISVGKSAAVTSIFKGVPVTKEQKSCRNREGIYRTYETMAHS